MSDAPPQLGDIPKSSDFNIPTLSSTTDHAQKAAPNGSTTMADNQDAIIRTKESIVGNAQTAVDTIANHPVTQNIKETVNNAPITEAVKDQHAKTYAEFNNLANARKVPETRTANDQPLTRYHSLFYTLLSWENPRSTGITFASIVTVILALRYVPLVSWALKALWITLGIIALAETGAKLVFGTGVSQSMRPKRYFTIPREALESSLEDAEQFINFFVLEFQRILFAENVIHTIAAFFATLTAYFLIRITPFWGLSLLGTFVLFLTPLVYVMNKDLIDHHIDNANQVVNAQTAQLRDLAGHHAANASSAFKSYAGDYTSKAQEMIGSKPGSRSVSSSSNVPKSEDFPKAPQQEPVAAAPAAAPEPQAAY